MLSLLPATEQDPLIEKGVKYFTEKVSSRSLFLVGHKDFQKAAAAIYGNRNQEGPQPQELRHGKSNPKQ